MTDDQVSCIKKKRHRTKSAARLHMAELVDKQVPGHDRLTVYPCRYGYHYHVGHLKGKS